MTAEPIRVPSALAGERLDRAVSLLTGRTRAEAGHLVDVGAVQLGGDPALRRSRRLRDGEWLAIDMSRAGPELSKVLGPARKGTVPFRIVQEGADFVVVDKPAGVVTHPGAGNQEGTLAGGLLALYPELSLLPPAGYGAAERPGIVHRLDKETSGLLVVARTPEGFSSLTSQLAARTAKRTYVALVNGSLGPSEGFIEGAIGRSARDPTSMAVVAEGKQARTSYQVRRRFSRPVPASELLLSLETGRTHQIRVHLAAIEHPVLGDSRYGGGRRSAGVGRLMLHAERLGFMDPRSGEPVEFTAPPPPEFTEALERFS